MTRETYTRCLKQLLEDSKREPIHLLFDVYRLHVQEVGRALAEQLQIALHFISAGMTDEYQPLDRRVFGYLKSSARKRFMPSRSKNANAKSEDPMQSTC
jgi:hypothetical protein